MALTKIPTHMLFSGAASEDLSIDSDTLFIDASANRVGIANNSPSVALDVTGALTVSGAITGTLATAAQTNITSLGTLTTLTVDDITINGSTISDSGDLDFDVGGEIKLDSDGEIIRLYHAGTQVGAFHLNNDDLAIRAMAQDKDIIFKGYDASSNITALTLDMSAAGQASFNAGITSAEAITVTNGNSTFTTASAWGATLTLKNTNDDASPAILSLHKDPASGHSTLADGDYIGFINMKAKDDAGNAHTYVELAGVATDVSSGAETSKFSINTWGAGTEYATNFVATGGKVGIGITPTHNFNLSASGAVEARFASTDNDTYLQISSDTDEGQDSILQFLAGTGAKGSITYDHNTTAASQKMIFKTGDNANDALYIYGDGTVKVGLGGSGGDLVLQPQAKLYLDAGGNTYIQESAGDVIDIYTGGTQRLRLNSSGATLDGNLSMTSSVIYASQIYVNDRVGHRDDASTFINFDTDRIEFATNGEAMRIDSSGGLLIAKTSQFSPTSKLVVSAGATGGTTPACSFQANTSTSSGSIVVFYKGNGGEVASIGMSNLNAGTSVSYNTGSDARWKDVTGEARGLEVINNLNPVAFNWKETGTADEGLIAQEVQEHMPNVVHEGNNGYLQMDYSKLVTPLIKALQEADDKIDALEARIATLESS
jgi:hypothetical protein